MVGFNKEFFKIDNAAYTIGLSYIPIWKDHENRQRKWLKKQP